VLWHLQLYWLEHVWCYFILQLQKCLANDQYLCVKCWSCYDGSLKNTHVILILCYSSCAMITVIFLICLYVRPSYFVKFSSLLWIACDMWMMLSCLVMIELHCWMQMVHGLLLLVYILNTFNNWDTWDTLRQTACIIGSLPALTSRLSVCLSVLLSVLHQSALHSCPHRAGRSTF